eukprot:4341299-Amphidinium_carterae.1
MYDSGHSAAQFHQAPRAILCFFISTREGVDFEDRHTRGHKVHVPPPSLLATQVGQPVELGRRRCRCVGQPVVGV